MMNGRFPYTWRSVWRNSLTLMIVASVTAPGCFRTELLSPNRISKYYDRDITIMLLDRRVFYFPAQSYSVVRTEAGPVISGTGKEYTGPGRTGPKIFKGTIPVSGIKYVEIERKTAFYYIIPAAFIAGMLVYIFVFKVESGGG